MRVESEPSSPHTIATPSPPSHALRLGSAGQLRGGEGLRGEGGSFAWPQTAAQPRDLHQALRGAPGGAPRVGVGLREVRALPWAGAPPEPPRASVRRRFGSMLHPRPHRAPRLPKLGK